MDSNGFDDLLICDGKDSGNVCKKSSKPGYYLNSENSNSKLLYCNDKNDCKTSKESDGYFINSFSYNYIKCSKSKCSLIDPDISCNNHQYEVILHDNQLFYCYGKNEISFTDIAKYYSLSKVQASSIYPEITAGSDTILLKIDQYSVTQFITSDEGK